MRSQFKTPAERERERSFALKRGEVWFRGARVTKQRVIPKRPIK